MKEKKPFSAAEHEAKKQKTTHPSGKPRWQRRKEAKKLPKGGCSVYVPPKTPRERLQQQEEDIRKALEARAKEQRKG